MEVALAGAASAAPTTPGAPGAEISDAAAEAFAALLGALMGATAPPPELVAEEAPAAPGTAEVVAALTGERAAYPALALIASAPIAGLTPAPAEAEAPVEAEAVADVDPDAEVPDLAAPRAAAPPVAAAPAATAATATTADAEPDAAPLRILDAIPLPAAAPAPVEVPAEADVPLPAVPSSPTAAVRVERPEIVSAPVAAPALPDPVEQVVRVVTPLRRLGDGQHDLVLELRPADLGAVRVELSLDKGVVHLGLRAEVEQTNQLLRAALPELRQQLDAAGVMAGRVAVDADAGSGARQWRTAPEDGATGRRRDETVPDDDEVTPTPAYSSSSAYGHVDVLL